LGPEAEQALAGILRGVEDLPAMIGKGRGVGSNSWVVSGEHTATGLPLLANDPHLGISVPGIWHQMGLHCRTVGPECPFEVSGFRFAGLPGVVIGHNDQVAWGFTNLGPDVVDLSLEQVRDDDTVRVGNRWEPMTVRTEEIAVLGEDSEQLTV